MLYILKFIKKFKCYKNQDIEQNLKTKLFNKSL